MALATPSDPPKLIRNRCVIDVLVGLFTCHFAFHECFVDVRAFLK